jgi:hypothetical protein
MGLVKSSLEEVVQNQVASKFASDITACLPSPING